MSARERYEELLIDEATGDLTPETRQELDALLLLHPDWLDDSFEIAAAALLVAMQPQLDVMPDDLRQRLKGV
jgi:hypothetical protein